MITIETALFGPLTISSSQLIDQSRTSVKKAKKTTKNIFTAINVDDNQPITIDEALKIRHKTHFTCDDCGHRLRAHKRSKTGANAHFEHLTKNPHCNY
jgi:transcription initiation factor IIE alpha subunit